MCPVAETLSLPPGGLHVHFEVKLYGTERKVLIGRQEIDSLFESEDDVASRWKSDRSVES